MNAPLSEPIRPLIRRYAATSPQRGEVDMASAMAGEGASPSKNFAPAQWVLRDAPSGLLSMRGVGSLASFEPQLNNPHAEEPASGRRLEARSTSLAARL